MITSLKYNKQFQDLYKIYKENIDFSYLTEDQTFKKHRLYISKGYTEKYTHTHYSSSQILTIEDCDEYLNSLNSIIVNCNHLGFPDCSFMAFLKSFDVAYSIEKSLAFYLFEKMSDKCENKFIVVIHETEDKY